MSLLDKGRFETDLQFTIQNKQFKAVAIIDTGCHTTTVSANLLFDTETLERLHKAEIEEYLYSGKKFIHAYSVTDTIYTSEIKSYEQVKNIITLRFPREVNNIKIGGYLKIDVKSKFLRYNRLWAGKETNIIEYIVTERN